MRKYSTICGWTLAVWMLTGLAWAGAGEKLAEAKTEIGNDHAYSADALLQEVVKDETATSGQVQEALFLQCMIYYGDVFGAALLLGPCGAASEGQHPFKQDVGEQLLLARRAFTISAEKYLNETVMQAALTRIKFTLPELNQSDVDTLQSVLADPATIRSMLTQYDADPSPARGLQARSNQFGFYICSGALLGPVAGQQRSVADIRSTLSQGVPYDHAAYLDWIASVLLDMYSLINEPNGPDFIGLSKRANDRLLSQYGSNPANQHVVNARERAAKYP